MLENKNCKLCHKPMNGRSDKKFCCEYCRNTYNNKMNRQSRIGMRSAHTILLRNRRILKEIIGEDANRKIPQAVLVSMGYHFDYLTSLKKTTDGELYRYCFEFHIRELNNEMIEIIR